MKRNSGIDSLNWKQAEEQLNEKGYALLSKVLAPKECHDLINNYDRADLYRKTIVMEHKSYGQGEYKYFNYPLPSLIQSLREEIYPYLAPVANHWMQQLKVETTFPDTFEKLRKLCHDNKQLKPTPLILKYKKGGFNALHQDLYGKIFFPFQVVFFLNEPGIDYKGGEFVLAQHKLRVQPKPIVLNPGKGDMLIFTTNIRPEKGKRGYYRVQVKHGVSEILEGERHTLGIIFHDAE